MKKAVVYIHGKSGNSKESEHFKRMPKKPDLSGSFCCWQNGGKDANEQLYWLS